MIVRRRLSAISCALGAAAALCGAGDEAAAATANFSASTAYANPEINTLSRANDATGPFIGLGHWIALAFAQPFATSKSDSVSVFTIAPPTGSAQFTVSFGRYNAGAPVIAASRNVNAGATLTVTNLFQSGCNAFGGCDFILITTNRASRGATGAAVDYVSVNGEPVIAVSPTPEPRAWMLMIVGFAMVAARAKALRASRRPAVLPAVVVV